MHVAASETQLPVSMMGTSAPLSLLEPDEEPPEDEPPDELAVPSVPPSCELGPGLPLPLLELQP